MTNFRKLGFCALVAIAAGAANSASAGRFVVDGTIAACSVNDIFGPVPTNGAVEVQITSWNLGDFPDCADVANPANRAPFSINYFGETYDAFYLNENGILSFGAPITADPSTALTDLLIPVIAPFFSAANLPSQSDLRVGYTLTNDTMWLTWRMEEEGAPGVFNDIQISFEQVGVNGDFNLILNYIGIGWDPGQAGFTDGKNLSYIFDGAGVPGAYLGDDNDDDPVCGPASIACLLGFGSGPDGNPSAGYYEFEFRDGVPINVTLNEIPLPAAPILFLTGIAGLMGFRRARR